MSVITDRNANDFYTKDPATGWCSVNFDNLQYKDQALEVEHQCTSDARMERLKALATAMIGGGVSLLLLGAAVIAYRVSALTLGIFALPLIIIPPLYKLVTVLGGLGVSAIFYLNVSKYGKQFFTQAKEHWNYGNHLYAQAHRARLAAPALARAKA